MRYNGRGRDGNRRAGDRVRRSVTRKIKTKKTMRKRIVKRGNKSIRSMITLTHNGLELYVNHENTTCRPEEREKRASRKVQYVASRRLRAGRPQGKNLVTGGKGRKEGGEECLWRKSGSVSCYTEKVRVGRTIQSSG